MYRCRDCGQNGHNYLYCPNNATTRICTDCGVTFTNTWGGPHCKPCVRKAVKTFKRNAGL